MRGLNLFGFGVLFFITASSCHTKDETKLFIWEHQKEIIDINETYLSKGKNLIFKTPLIIPIHVLTADSSLILFDYAGSEIKQFFLDSSERGFYPLNDGPTRIEGEFFKGVGVDELNQMNLLIETNKAISRYNFLTKEYTKEVVDKYPHCPSFNSPFHEVFTLFTPKETITISQNGSPCYEVANLAKEVTPENFRNKFFVRITSASSSEVNYSLKLPDIPIDNLYERFRLYLTFNKSNNKFYAMLNPLDYLFEYEFDDSAMELRLTDYWKLNLKFADLPVDHFLLEEIDPIMVNKSLDYNFELNFIDSSDRFVLVSYTPSKDLIFDNPKDAPYSSHYFLAILDLRDKEIKTLSLNYDEFQFYGISKDLMWIYDVLASEKSGDTIFKLLKIEDIYNRKG